MSVAGQSRQPVELAIADESLCANACREIYTNRPRWRARRLKDQLPFYTLGAASYLDLWFFGGSVEDYLADAGSLWQWAGDDMRLVMEHVRAALAEHLDQPVEYVSALPTPGFHIFVGAGIPRTDCARALEDCGSCHFDLQHTLIPWERWYASVDLEDTISFTLPLALPTEGGGLTLWESLSAERMHDEIASHRFSSVLSTAHVTPSATIRYSIGRLVLHNGHVLHQMAGVRRISVTDERITLQGHGVFADGAWRLYW